VVHPAVVHLQPDMCSAPPLFKCFLVNDVRIRVRLYAAKGEKISDKPPLYELNPVVC
jgi:hypothetical protein